MMIVPLALWLAVAVDGEPSGPATTAAATSSASRSSDPQDFKVGAFVGADWRVLGLSGHLSHGPGFQIGLSLWRHVSFGLAGFARPGPINPVTFRVPVPDGGTYRGKSTVSLRSDGGVVGAFVAPYFDLRRAPLSIEIPVLVAYGGFGFYLHGEDRKVPDDRRVSEWENELLDGRDSDPVNLVIDAGIRLAWTPPAQRHIRPYLGVHYTWVPGFDTAVRGNYDGFSGVLGVKFGRWAR
ncbi:MAG: hypothetical protein AAGF11_30025 [Myxococcota bacterium]